MRIVGLALFGWLLCAGSHVPGARAERSEQAEGANAARTVLVAHIDGAITGGTLEYLKAALTAARERHAAALCIEINTPGGLLDATREITSLILDAEVPVITYVFPAGAHAGSAGTFIVLASHVAAMVPASNIGAAHPVGAFGGDIEGDMKEKVENDAAAFARTLAEAHGRNSAWAEKSVRESASITASEALDQHVVDFVAKDLGDLLRKADGMQVQVRGKARVLQVAGASQVVFERSGQQKLYDWLANPGLLYVVLLLGVLGIYVEFQHPGLFVPGLLGATCLGIVIGLQVLPLNWLGVSLIGLSAVLFIAEVYVTSFGILSVAAIACLVAGSYMLFDVPGSSLRVDPLLIWGVAGCFALIAIAFGIAIMRVKRRGPTAGPDALVGQIVLVTRAVGPGAQGRVFADGTSWLASSEQPAAEGARVRIVGRDGLTLRVQPENAL